MMARYRLGLCGALLATAMLQPAMAAEQEHSGLSVTGLSASAGEDDPRVLYILPWQTPSLPRRPRAELNSQAPELKQPRSPRVLENHRQFRETLNPSVLKPTPTNAGSD